MGLHLGNLSEPTFEAGLIQRLGSLTDKRVLELGCGLAPHARLLSDFTQYYVAIDISWRKLADCRIFGQSNTRYIICSDGIALPFPDNSFDRVVLAHFIHEVDSSLQPMVMKEIQRVLIPEGKIIILDTTEKTSEFQKCFDIVHEDYQYYNHRFNLRHSKWLINKLMTRRMFLLEEKQKASLDFHFSSIDQIINILVEDFKYEYHFTQLEKEQISQSLKKVFKKKVTTNIIINEQLDIYLLRNNK